MHDSTERSHYCSRTFENAIWHSHALYEALRARPDIRPDLIVAHSGFLSTVFLRELYDCPVGYSGHEVGLPTTVAAIALGASLIERHITLDRAMWGSDQAASVEIGGLLRLVASIRDIERSLGDGVKRIYEGELAARKKLRRVVSAPAIPTN